GGTYYGYDPLGGQAIAFPDEKVFKQYFQSFDPQAGDLPFDPSELNANPGKLTTAPVDYSSVAKAAAAAGLSYNDFHTLISSANPISEKSIDDIKNGLGIPTVQTAAFTAAPDTNKIYNDAYTAAGLGDLKKKIEAFNETVNKKRADLNTATGTV